MTKSAAGWQTGSNYRLTTQRGRNVILRETDRRTNGDAGESQSFRHRRQRPRLPRRLNNGEDGHDRISHLWLIIGAIAGWLAGQIVKGYGLGLVGNIVVGIVGAVIAGWLLPMIGLVIGGGILAAIVNAVIGAVILLIIVGFFKK